MRNLIRVLTLAIALTASPFLPAFASPFQDAIDALKRLDYVEAERLLTPLAHNGSPTAQYLIGFVYWERRESQLDTDTALRWFEKAADNGSGLAQFKLGTIYEEGDQVARDFKRALRYYRQAANNRLAPPKGAKERLAALEKALGNFSVEEPDERQSDGQALSLAIVKCDQLASHHRDEFSKAPPVTLDELRKSATQAIGACTKALESGEARHYFQLGRAYLAIGENKKGLGYYRSAADKGHYVAAYWYGRYHRLGERGVAKNGQLARKYLLVATEAKIARDLAGSAYEDLGLLHSVGLSGIEKNLKQVRTYYGSCHDRGITNCAYRLARFYDPETRSPPTSAKRAIELYEQFLAKSSSTGDWPDNAKKRIAALKQHISAAQANKDPEDQARQDEQNQEQRIAEANRRAAERGGPSVEKTVEFVVRTFPKLGSSSNSHWTKRCAKRNKSPVRYEERDMEVGVGLYYKPIVEEFYYLNINVLIVYYKEHCDKISSRREYNQDYTIDISSIEEIYIDKKKCKVALERYDAAVTWNHDGIDRCHMIIKVTDGDSLRIPIHSSIFEEAERVVNALEYLAVLFGTKYEDPF